MELKYVKKVCAWLKIGQYRKMQTFKHDEYIDILGF
jgi:hypothetical protein